MAEKASLLISLGALLLAAFSLGWNFYRDVILKARLQVRIQLSAIHSADKKHGSFIDISATNFGPGSVICNGVIIAKKSFFRIFGKKTKFAYIVHDYTNPLSSNLPKKLEVGESLTLLFPIDQESFISRDPTHIGIRDSFGRLHWATKKSLKQTKEEYFQEFKKLVWGQDSSKR